MHHVLMVLVAKACMAHLCLQRSCWSPCSSSADCDGTPASTVPSTAGRDNMHGTHHQASAAPAWQYYARFTSLIVRR